MKREKKRVILLALGIPVTIRYLSFGLRMVFFSWCLSPLALVQADEVYLRNGDRISGEISNMEDGTLTIETTPESNPNYFFNDYHRKGDKYNKPKKDKVHMKAWEELSYIIEFINKMYPEHKVSLTNYNSKESISQYFTTKPLEDFPMGIV